MSFPLPPADAHKGCAEKTETPRGAFLSKSGPAVHATFEATFAVPVVYAKFGLPTMRFQSENAPAGTSRAAVHASTADFCASLGRGAREQLRICFSGAFVYETHAACIEVACAAGHFAG